ncbi:MAG TPA: T9SS type A sorting domain-containing protein [Chitinophagales bacterium]|nr:T9SS type A sorting domain-containing protein [Chitinophagales bacterium]
MKKLLLILVTSFLLPSPLIQAQTPDWSTTIASIFYNHCAVCHHESGIAPFSLLTYNDAFDNGFSIEADVNAKIMPPWPPDPNYSHLRDEKVLSENEITAIDDWVDNGMPIGDTSLAPDPPVYNGSSLMVNPDETVYLPVFTVPDVGDVYWRFVNQSGYNETKYLNSVEFVAGNPSIMHHVTVGYDKTGLAHQDDLDYPGPGCPRDFGSNPWNKIFMSQSEGRVTSLPPNIGFRIPDSSDYVSDMHYYTSSLGEVDSSKINIKFCTVPDVRSVSTEKLIYGDEPSLIDGPLEIAANTIQTFHLQSSVFAEDQSLIGFGPHAHLICKSWKVYIVTPSADTIPLISIPNWNFDWQGSYMLTKVIKIPAGSVIYATAVYDNTNNNPHNPNNPPEDIHSGQERGNEMAQVHFWLMDYQPGDEDIILDSTFYGIPSSQESIDGQLAMNIYPNPASDVVHLISNLPAHDVNWQLTDLFGVVVKSMNLKNVSEGVYSHDVDVSGLCAGLYQLSIQSGGVTAVKKLIVIR